MFALNNSLKQKLLKFDRIKQYRELITIIIASIIITYVFTFISYALYRNAFADIRGMWQIYDANHYI